MLRKRCTYATALGGTEDSTVLDSTVLDSTVLDSTVYPTHYRPIKFWEQDTGTKV